MNEDFADWIGRSTQREDVATARLAGEYRATLAPFLFRPADEDECPPGFHWGLAPAMPGMDEAGPDGAEAKGLFLPPIPLPRRVWAGGTIETARAIRLGDKISRRSTLADLRLKRGTAGDFWVASIVHEISDAEGLMIRERQDLVFRELGAAAPQARMLDQIAADWHVDASALLLFRFSAFTFNGHRIHYDVHHAAAEGYPALLVHGPLQAALMLNLAAARLGAVPHLFEYRCLAPLYGGHRFGVAYDGSATPAAVRVIRGDGVKTAEGRIRVRETG